MGSFQGNKDAGAKWVPRLEKGAVSKHQAIFDAIVADIASGRLRLGDRLPPQRAVAAALGVDLTTVTKAYSRARTEGIIEATTGRGSFVAIGTTGHGGGESGLPVLDLSKNSPPRFSKLDVGSALAKELEQTIAMDGSSSILNYQDTGGNWANRAAGASWLTKRLVKCDTERVVLTSGAQSALFAICHLLSRRNRQVAVGQFSYPGIHTVAFQQGLHLVPLAMDGEGILAEAFQEACERSAPGALYITPTADNPTTTTMSTARREEIVRIARRHAVAIIEDDPYSELITNPPAAIAALAPDLTWHIATLSKCLTPALRLGYVAAPTADASRQLAATLQAMTMMASPLFAMLASRWIYSGFLQEMAASISAENVERQKIAAAIFADQHFAANRQAQHFWLGLPNPWRAIDFTHQSERQGVITLASSSFSVNSPTAEAVRISLGGAPTRAVLEAALNTIKGVLTAGQPNALRAMV